jgi:phosphoribosylformimino-5-aminoimidazole carboxamide ribotide isomerase
VIVIPALDLQGGRCVRLVEGRPETATVFGDDPVAWARRWMDEGAERLHVVDLDGAFAGGPRHAALIAAIVRAAAAPVQVGGGLRDLDSVGGVLATGARWAILGTAAALDRELLLAACSRWPDRILVGVDAADGQVAVDGWTRVLPLTAAGLGRRAAAAGAAAVIYTDVRRDGTGRGPNLDATAALAAAAGLPIIASGGIAGVEDLRRLAGIPGVIGAIVGRALYTGAVDLRVAAAAVARDEPQNQSHCPRSLEQCGGGEWGRSGAAPPHVD